MEEEQLNRLQERIGYRFRNRGLLLQSLTHPSYVQEFPCEGSHNQRMEFLGDAILSAILAERLYTLFPDEREGALSRGRSALAMGGTLADLAVDLELDRCVRLGSGEEQNGGRSRGSTLEDAFEALVGAVFLDSDWETVHTTVVAWFGEFHRNMEDLPVDDNPKGRLQELVQPNYGNDAIVYRVLTETGPAHDKRFTVGVFVDHREMGRGEGSAKKRAEENAARGAIRTLQMTEKSDR